MTAPTPHGTVVWSELNCRDVGQAKAFYAATLGWSFVPMEIQGGDVYWIIKHGETEIGGIFALTDPEFEGVPSHWLTYIAVDDLDARLERVGPAGGQVLRPAFDVPDVGRIAIVKDAAGAVAGWMTPRI